MKLWDKGYSIEKLVENFTVANDRELDLRLTKYDILGSKAHAEMLEKIEILSEAENKSIQLALDKLLIEYEEGNFVIEDQFEDIHSKIEYELIQSVGEAAKKIHTARSRNDQILVDMHLYFKEECIQIEELISSLFETLLQLAEKYSNVLMPGYTHTQVAMPSSFALWFGAFAESLIDDLLQLKTSYQIADQNPLGSAAGFGSSFPIDRSYTTKLLGFSELKYNVVAAQMNRGRLEKSMAFSLSSIASTLSKLANDICLYNSQNFAFVSFPKELTTGSSIMPHKQNPDVFELVRANCNKSINLPNEISLIVGNLISGYHRDFQLLKESIFKGIDRMKSSLEITNYMLNHIEVKKDILDNPIYNYLFSVEKVNELVMQGMSFRDAYQEIGKKIIEGSFESEGSTNLNHTHEGSIGNPSLGEIRRKFEKALISNRSLKGNLSQA